MSEPIPSPTTPARPTAPSVPVRADAETASYAGLPSQPTTLPQTTGGTTPPTGERGSIPGYDVLATLGRGGMGVVYQARQTKLGRIVALKMILSGAHAGETELGRFRTEAEAIARLQHPNIVQIYEVGEHGGLPYFSLEFCGGGSLAKKLAGTPLPPGEAAALVETLARAMQAAHQKGVIHRDLKPANILLASGGCEPPVEVTGGSHPPLAGYTPKISDFGLAKKLDEAGQTVSGAIMGTPSYMAPEQAAGRPAGPLADVYALGAILYECLTGRPPFRAATTMETLEQVLHHDPARPSLLQARVPRDLETICLKCLEKDAARRYGGAGELADEMRRFRGGEPIAARPAGLVERARKWAKRRPAAAALLGVSLFAGLTLVSVAGAAAALVYGKNRELTNAYALVQGKNQELSEANRLLIEERNHARTAEGEAVAKSAALEKSQDRLEGSLARYLLRPLALQGGNRPMTDPEWDSLWELAASHPGRLGYRFLEEATRTPGTTRQLRDRAALALAAAVGLDAQRRAEVEALLLARLDDASLGAEQRADVAVAASRWDGLDRPAANRVARELSSALAATRTPAAWLVRAMLAQGLAAVAPRMGPDEARTVLGRAMNDAREPYPVYFLAQGELALASRGEDGDSAAAAARVATRLAETLAVTADANAARTLALGLAAWAPRMRAGEAAPLLVRAMGRTRDRDAYVLSPLEETLRSVAGRLAPAEAAAAAATLLQALKEPSDAKRLYSLALGLSYVAADMEPKEAAAVSARAAAVLLQAMSQTRVAPALGVLEEGLQSVAAHMDARERAAAIVRGEAILLRVLKESKDFHTLGSLAQSLSRLAARMEPRDAAEPVTQAADVLFQAMKDAPESFVRTSLALGLSDLATRMDDQGAARVAATLVAAVKTIREPDLTLLAISVSETAARLANSDVAPAAATLLRAIEESRDADTVRLLAEALSVVATRLEAREAVAMVLRGMGETGGANALLRLAVVLARLAPRLEAGDAARTAAALLQGMKGTASPYALRAQAVAVAALADRLAAGDAAMTAAQAAAILRHALADTTEPWALVSLALGLSALAPRLDAGDTAGLILRGMKASRDPVDLASLARSLAGVVARRDAAGAAAIAAEGATVLVQAMKDATDTGTSSLMADALSALLFAIPAAERPSRAATVAAALSGNGRLLAVLGPLVPALGAPACRLSTQQLADLLKMPTCIGEARRVVLDHLGHRYQRHFADVWEFVHYAEEQHLGLDFRGPPQRPEPIAGAAAVQK